MIRSGRRGRSSKSHLNGLKRLDGGKITVFLFFEGGVRDIEETTVDSQGGTEKGKLLEIVKVGREEGLIEGS